METQPGRYNINLCGAFDFRAWRYYLRIWGNEGMDNLPAKLARWVVRSPETYKYLREKYTQIRSIAFSHDLVRLALIHDSAKWGIHWYAKHYENHFKSLRWRKLKILEIGTGGYDNPNKGGKSLRMWKYFFPRSDIFSIDIFDKSALEEPRIKIFQGNQNDPDFLKTVVENMSRVDIVIDDGSHVNDHVITSFQTLFPLVSDGGIYVIEDTQTSYWPEFGGDSYDLRNANTTMNFLKSLADGLNYQEIARKNYQPSYFEKNIVALHFYHNLAFLYKGKNDEGSNFVYQHIY